MLGISLFQMYWRIWKLTLKTLLMEVFTASTPTSSGNYKANLEGLQDETPATFSCRAYQALLEGNADLLPC